MTYKTRFCPRTYPDTPYVSDGHWCVDCARIKFRRWIRFQASRTDPALRIAVLIAAAGLLGLVLGLWALDRYVTGPCAQVPPQCGCPTAQGCVGYAIDGWPNR